ncbi:DNRLRE domain-containing protein [Massilia sp. CMS3.1]|uniref:DNRLRE domain-containing protein n=1 Tax=Massilia sp. CMS3.1 TaxID=3373083 RepID=UPI003EE5FA4A
MSRARQQGILLLPVALTLAIIGALAYTMTRDGSMNVAAVDAQYDIDVARYLATSGVQLAKWRASKSDCNSNYDEDYFGTPDLPGGTVAVSDIDWNKGKITVSLTTKNSKAVHALTRSVQVYDVKDPKDKVIIGDGDDDTTIIRNNNTIQSSEKSLLATDGDAHPLVYFELPGELDKASIIQADLKLTKEGSASTQTNRSLAVHRITTAWSHGSATWVKATGTPWAAPGGDYVATPAASVTIDPNAPSQYNGIYTLRIDSLVQGWADGALPNYGMLLKPTRLVNAKFVSFDGSNKPQLDVRYYLRCS